MVRCDCIHVAMDMSCWSLKLNHTMDKFNLVLSYILSSHKSSDLFKSSSIISYNHTNNSLCMYINIRNPPFNFYIFHPEPEKVFNRKQKITYFHIQNRQFFFKFYKHVLLKSGGIYYYLPSCRSRYFV